jgi:hypothetical protein
MNILKVFITLYTTLVIKNLTSYVNWLLGAKAIRLEGGRAERLKAVGL